MNHNTKTLIDLATSGLRGTNRGRAMSLHSRLGRPTTREPALKQRQFLGGLLEQPRESASGAYDHPRDGVSHHVDKNKTVLLPSDLAWLDRLPRDPSKVSLDDARTVRSLLDSLKLGRASESDRRLVLTYWNPIKTLHDRAEAEHNLQVASQPVPNVTSAAIAAVAETLQNDDPALDAEIASIKAQRLLDNAASVKATERANTIRLAQLRLDRAPVPDEA